MDKQKSKFLESLSPSLKAMVLSVLTLPDPALHLAKLAEALADREENVRNQAITIAIAARSMSPDDLQIRYITEWAFNRRVPRWHFRLVNDEHRNEVYQLALNKYIVPGKSIVLEVGTGSGILAMMAAKAGAAHVYTCEMEPLVAEAAKRNIEQNGFSDKITVIPKKSYGVLLETDLPCRADILVSEIVDDHLLGEDVLPIVADAKKRLLKSDAIILPRHIEARGVLVGGSEWQRYAKMSSVMGFDLTAMNWLGPSSVSLEERQLTQPIACTFGLEISLLKFDFEKETELTESGEHQLSITINRTGMVNGIVRWLYLDFGYGITFDNRPPKKSVWRAQYHMFLKPMAVEEGKTFNATITYRQKRIYVIPRLM